MTNFQKIVNGDTPIDRDSSEKVFKSQNINTTNELSFSEKTIREKVDKREKYDIDVIPGGALTKDVLPELLLFPPLVGEITNKMNICSEVLSLFNFSYRLQYSVYQKRHIKSVVLNP